MIKILKWKYVSLHTDFVYYLIGRTLKGIKKIKWLYEYFLLYRQPIFQFKEMLFAYILRSSTIIIDFKYLVQLNTNLCLKCHVVRSELLPGFLWKI